MSGKKQLPFVPPTEKAHGTWTEREALDDALRYVKKLEEDALATIWRVHPDLRGTRPPEDDDENGVYNWLSQSKRTKKGLRCDDGLHYYDDHGRRKRGIEAEVDAAFFRLDLTLELRRLIEAGKLAFALYYALQELTSDTSGALGPTLRAAHAQFYGGSRRSRRYSTVMLRAWHVVKPAAEGLRDAGNTVPGAARMLHVLSKTNPDLPAVPESTYKTYIRELWPAERRRPGRPPKRKKSTKS